MPKPAQIRSVSIYRQASHFVDRRTFVERAAGCLASIVAATHIGLSAGVPLLAGAAEPVNSSAETYDLMSRPYFGVRVKTILEAEGSLELADAKAPDPVQVPIRVSAEHFFDQRNFPFPQGVVESSSVPTGCWRHYWEAKAHLEIQGKPEDRVLRPSVQLQVLAQDPASPQNLVYGSPSGPLTREEFDLLDVIATRFHPESLLPTVPVSIEQSWEHEAEIAERLLNLNDVQRGGLQSKLESIDASIAKVALQGSVSGIIDGVQAEFEVVGKYHIERESRVVTWLTLSVREQREESFAAPAFSVVSRIRTARQPLANSEALTDQVIASLPKQLEASHLLLEFSDPTNGYRMLVDRRAILMSREATGSVWRLIDKNKMLATGKIDRLHKLPEGKDVSLTQFQADVRTALGSNLERLDESSETVNSHGVRILRVVAIGKAGGIPITWIYYHLGHSSRTRLSAVFTLESSLHGELGGLDESLVSSVEILPQIEAPGGEIEKPEGESAPEGSTLENARRGDVESR